LLASSDTIPLVILKMGGAKKWLDPHVKFCFSKFTDSENEVEKWCIVGADSNGNHALVVPKTTRGGLDLVKLWYKEAGEEHTELSSMIKLQRFRTNVHNTAKKWHDGANNPANGPNLSRTTYHATHDHEDKDGNDVPAIPSDMPQAANEDNISIVCDSIIIIAYNGKGNNKLFNYIQCKYVTSSTSSSNFQSTNKCHIIIHAPSGWKLSDQNPFRVLHP
jgi:hypothetical protein